MDLVELNFKLADLSQGGHTFTSQIIPGDVPVLQVFINGIEELPIFISASETQIICITYLWAENEVKPESRTELLENMLSMNIPMPLSSFSKIADRFVVFGALSIHSQFDDIIYELVNLSENAIEAISAFEDYLQ